jgi:hypothetical protein
MGISLEQARRISKDLLGSDVDRIEPFLPRVGGYDSHCFRLWTWQNQILLKIMKHPGKPIGIYFHDRLEQAGIPVPKLIAFSKNAGPNGEASVIWDWVQGEPVRWHPGQPCPYDEAQLGELLRAIHELPFDGSYGFLCDSLSERSYTWHPHLGPISKAWSEFFHCSQVAAQLFKDGYLDEEEAEILSGLAENLRKDLDCTPRSLLHTDIRNNMILEPGTGRILAVFDFTESCAGDPRWELAWIDYWFIDRFEHFLPFDMTRFRAAYGTDHNLRDPIGRFYLAMILSLEAVPTYDPTSLGHRWAVLTLKTVLRTFCN